MLSRLKRPSERIAASLCALVAFLACGRSQQPAEVDIGMRSAVIHRLPLRGDTSMQAGVALVESPPEDPRAIADAYVAEANRVGVKYAHSANVVLLCAGPALDSPDSAELRSYRRVGAVLRLLVAYTSARAQGRPLRRNVRWQPMLEVPLPPGLQAGQHTVEVTWEAWDALPDGKPLAVESLRMSTTFSIGE